MTTQTQLEKQSFEDIREYLETRANISHNKELIDKLAMQSNSSIYSMETLELIKQLRVQLDKENTTEDLSPQYINMLDDQCANDHIEYIKERIVEQFDFSEKPLHENQNDIGGNLIDYLDDLISRLFDDIKWVREILPDTHNQAIIYVLDTALRDAKDYKNRIRREVETLEQAQENIMAFKQELINY